MNEPVDVQLNIDFSQPKAAEVVHYVEQQQPSAQIFEFRAAAKPANSDETMSPAMQRLLKEAALLNW